MTFAYDALGRQVARATGGVTTTYYYNGNNVIDEYNGTSYAQYTWGPGGQVRRGAEYTLYDGLGSVTKITDGSGTPSEQITFDAFGRTQNIGGTSSDPYQYKSEYGYRTDGDGNADGQGIIKVGARYYDPLFGRFITRDKALSQSPYAYCEGDPVNNVDPSGYKPKTTITWHVNPDGTLTKEITTLDDDGSWTITDITYNVDNTPVTVEEWSSDGSWSKSDWEDVLNTADKIGTGEQVAGGAILGCNLTSNPGYIGTGVGNPFVSRNPWVCSFATGLVIGGTGARLVVYISRLFGL